MKNQEWDRLLMDLSNHEKVAAVEIDGEDLVARMGGEAIRVTSDRDFGRTVLWAPVLGVRGDALAAASEAAARFNTEHCADSVTTAGFFVQKSVLLIGKSIQVEEMGAGDVVREALDLIDSLLAARSFVRSALDGGDAEAGRPAMPDMPAVRV